MAGVTGRKRRIVKPAQLEAKFAPGFLDRIDKRFRPAQLVALHVQEFTTALGGEDYVTPQQRALVERAAWAHRRLQEIEAQYAEGQGLDANEWATLTGSLTRCLQLLGLGRKAKPVESLHSYMSRKAAAPAPPPTVPAPARSSDPLTREPGSDAASGSPVDAQSAVEVVP
jgi:hypothetical protein